jgi:hypothetical protein
MFVPGANVSGGADPATLVSSLADGRSDGFGVASS